MTKLHIEFCFILIVKMDCQSYSCFIILFQWHTFLNDRPSGKTGIIKMYSKQLSVQFQFDDNILLGCGGQLITFEGKSSGFSWIQLCSRIFWNTGSKPHLHSPGMLCHPIWVSEYNHPKQALNLKGYYFLSCCPSLHEKKKNEALQLNMQKVTMVLWYTQITVHINFFKRKILYPW